MTCISIGNTGKIQSVRHVWKINFQHPLDILIKQPIYLS